MKKYITLLFTHFMILGFGLYLGHKYYPGPPPLSSQEIELLENMEKSSCDVSKRAVEGCERAASSVHKQLFACERGIVFWEEKAKECLERIDNYKKENGNVTP